MANNNHHVITIKDNIFELILLNVRIKSNPNKLGKENINNIF